MGATSCLRLSPSELDPPVARLAGLAKRKAHRLDLKAVEPELDLGVARDAVGEGELLDMVFENVGLFRFDDVETGTGRVLSVIGARKPC